MTRTDATLVTAVLIACAGCSAREPRAPPLPAAMLPAAGLTSVETAVEIVGEGFHPRGVQAADGGSEVDATFRGWLGATELFDVEWVDARRLRARVPAGLAVGEYDLVVEGPHGTGRLANAFLVVDGLPPSLAVSLAVPPRVTLGDELQAIVTVRNEGTWLVEDVVAHVALAGDGALEALPGAPGGLGVLPDEAIEIALRYVAVRTGAIQVVASVVGRDPRTGGPVSAQATGAVVVRPPPSVAVVADDPFADGSAFAFVAGYRGQIYAGPNRSGTGLVRLNPDGTALESLSLSFSRDAVGNQSGNQAYPYRSIGFTGCSTNSPVNACGPDNENGRGFMTSAVLAGDEWLVLGGAKSGGDLEYVYMSRSATAPLDFSYVDLSSALGGNTRGFSAAQVAGGRLYLGFPDNGGSRPYGVALLAAPPTPGGLDAVDGTHVVNFNLHDAYAALYGQLASVSMVDAFAELGGRLYVFNNSGCVVAADLAPATKDDFTACSPEEGPAYALAQSVEPTRQYDLEPRDRAWPAAVAWKGRLLAIRNTYAGPQLWRCDPAGGTDPTACDRRDWTLVAADENGLLTRFGKPDAVASLLLATETDLWIGFDGASSGVRLFRTSVEAPALASDFRGRDGCIAGAPGCEGVGGDGLGAPATFTRIFDGEAMDWSGGTDLLLAAGDGSGPVRIVRVAP